MGKPFPPSDVPHARRIRPAIATDVPAMAEIERRAFSDAWPASAFRSLLSSPAARVTVAEEAGSVSGYSVVMLVADEAELANIAVADGARRRGVGRELLGALLESARAEGARSMFLEVRESNAAARALYAEHGFAPLGRRRGYYRAPDEDALVLVWRAPDPTRPEAEGDAAGP